ncbi:MAG: quercetin 2,3-dioxygenase [Chloroflexota bacterium]|nr:quercetin 2,3-dioxygenase [Chloroflexota bacterium]
MLDALRAAILLADHVATAQEESMSEETAHTTALEPVAVPAGYGEARWWGDGLAEVKATAADTGGQMTILEITEPPNKEAPLHVHHKEEEGFWILEGSATFQVGDHTIEARAGDYLLGPRDIPHRYTTGPDGCRMLFIFTPGGFEELLRAISAPAERRTLPPPDAPAPTPSAEEMERMQAMIQAHGCELLE